MTSVCLARNAMATRFEIVLPGDNAVALRAAGEAALDEVDRIEARLSPYRSTSEIAHVNRHAAHELVRVTPGVFALLQRAERLSEETGGAFDITVAPLVHCWGFMDGNGRIPSAEELGAAREKVGMRFVQLSETDCTVWFAREGVVLDLGAIGKGYAVDQAVEVLREAGIVSALIHGGTSTIYGLGQPPDADSWKVAIKNPLGRTGYQPVFTAVVPQAGLKEDAAHAGLSGPLNSQGACSTPLATVSLRNESLSVSAVWGRCFEAEGNVFGHVLDPRTGQPVQGALLAAVVLPSATESDAFSTALLVLGSGGRKQVARRRPDMRTLLAIASENGEGLRLEANGIAACRFT